MATGRTVPRTCRYCGQDFNAPVSNVTQGYGKFCSRRCGNSSRRCLGSTVHTEGYVLLKAPDHPDANLMGFIYEHRMLAGMILGRRLRSDEVVHHVNGNRADNSLSNLIITSRSAHMRQHAHERELLRGVTDPVRDKFCPRCQTVKPRSAFSPSTSRGRRTVAAYCRPCALAYYHERMARKEQV